MKKMVNTKVTPSPLKDSAKKARNVERDLLPSTPPVRQLPAENRQEIEKDDASVDP